MTFKAPDGTLVSPRRKSPKEAARDEFARRLQQRMIAKGYSQVDLAGFASRHLEGDEKFERGTISSYIRGLAIPVPRKLTALAKALDCAPEDLVPTRALHSTLQSSEPIPTAGMRELEDGNVWLTINQAVPWDTALKIMKLLKGGE